MISAVNTANNFIRRSKQEDIAITPLKLQKLVYFLYKQYLQSTKCKLFSEQFETWKYGPVVPSIYTEFSSYGNDPIKSYAQDSQGNCFVVEEKGSLKKRSTRFGQHIKITLPQHCLSLLIKLTLLGVKQNLTKDNI